MNKLSITAYLVGSTILISTFVGANAADSTDFRYEVISNISSIELWHSNQHLIVGDGVSILYFSFDPEDAARKGSWIAQGIVMGGSGDLGSKPVAIRLWAKSHAVLNEDSAAASAGKVNMAAQFESRGRCAPNTSCQPARFEFSVMADGKVLADGQLVGRVE